MWQLYSTAKTTCQRSSSLVGIDDPWIALQFDNAVSLVGVVIENASQETIQVGTKKEPKTERKYHMEQLLDPAFRLPAPKTQAERERENAQSFLNWARSGVRGVKVIRG